MRCLRHRLRVCEHRLGRVAGQC